MTSPSEATARCYVCGTTDRDAFSESQLKLMAGEYDGRPRPSTRCKECDNARAREHYARNAERIKARHRQHSATHYSAQGSSVRRFRVEFAPGIPRMPRTWERVERPGALKWWERESGYKPAGMSLRGATQQWPEPEPEAWETEATG